MPILAADLGGTTMKVGLVEKGYLLETTTLPAAPSQGLAHSLERLAGAFHEICARLGLTICNCQGVGLALACHVDGPNCRVIRSVKGKYEDAATVNLAGWARDRLGLKLTLETDSRAALLGEWRYGAGRGCDNLVMVTLGTAIGVAVLMQGTLLRGAHHQAGRGGHFIVNPGGRTCNCGGRGCVTAEASTWALPRLARDHPGFSASGLALEPMLNYEAVFRLARRGDTVAQAISERSLDVWSAMVVSLIHLSDPERVILGGGILHSADMIIPHIQKRLEEWAWKPLGAVRIMLAHHLQFAALLGVSSLVEQNVAVL